MLYCHVAFFTPRGSQLNVSPACILDFPISVVIGDCNKKYEHLDALSNIGKESFQGWQLKSSPIVKAFYDSKNIKINNEYGVPSLCSDTLIELSYAGLLKYNHSWTIVSNDILVIYSEYVKMLFPFSDWRMSSISEAVDELDKTTSCGFPLNKWFSNKREYFDSGCFEIDYALFEANFLSYDYCTVFFSFLKEELRPMEKIKQNKLRQINGPGLFYTVYYNRFMRVFIQQFMNMYTYTPSAVGMNALSGQFSMMMKQLSKHKSIWCKDGAAWDAYFSPQCHEIITNALVCCMKLSSNELEVFTKLREIIMRSPVLAMDGNIFLTRGGNKSGSITTTFDNTIHNAAMTAVCCYIQTGDFDYYFKCFDKNFGDDSLFGAPTDFPFKAFEVNCLKFGLVVTQETASGNRYEDTTPLLDVVFLSRVPIVRDGYYVSRHVAGPKCLESLLKSNEDLDPYYLFERACGMRTAYFFNDEFVQIDAFCKYLLKNFGDVSWNSIYHTESFIFRLYTSHECLVTRCLNGFQPSENIVCQMQKPKSDLVIEVTVLDEKGQKSKSWSGKMLRKSFDQDLLQEVKSPLVDQRKSVLPEAFLKCMPKTPYGSNPCKILFRFLVRRSPIVACSRPQLFN